MPRFNELTVVFNHDHLSKEEIKAIKKRPGVQAFAWGNKIEECLSLERTVSAQNKSLIETPQLNDLQSLLGAAQRLLADPRTGLPRKDERRKALDQLIADLRLDEAVAEGISA